MSSFVDWLHARESAGATTAGGSLGTTTSMIARVPHRFGSDLVTYPIEGPFFSDKPLGMTTLSSLKKRKKKKQKK